jgi:hypothetical protein
MGTLRVMWVALHYGVTFTGTGEGRLFADIEEAPE